MTVYNCGHPFGCPIKAPVSALRVLVPQTDTQGAVTVRVAPLDVSKDTQERSFEITMDTHSIELDDDLVAQSLLLDEQGKEYSPVLWDGDPPGGHHRKGTLTFAPRSLFPQAIRLIIRDVGDVQERRFEWRM